MLPNSLYYLKPIPFSRLHLSPAEMFWHVNEARIQLLQLKFLLRTLHGHMWPNIWLNANISWILAQLLEHTLTNTIHGLWQILFAVPQTNSILAAACHQRRHFQKCWAMKSNESFYPVGAGRPLAIQLLYIWRPRVWVRQQEPSKAS